MGCFRFVDGSWKAMMKRRMGTAVKCDTELLSDDGRLSRAVFMMALGRTFSACLCNGLSSKIKQFGTFLRWDLMPNKKSINRSWGIRITGTK